MSDLTATLRIESPALPLTKTVAADETATVRPVSGAGTAPGLGAFLFSVRTDDFDRFEAALEQDDTIEAYERVVEHGAEAVYRFEYSDEATVFSGAVAEVSGTALEWTHDEAAWTVRVWLPNREALAALSEFAADHDIDFTLKRVSDYARPDGMEPRLTEDQRETLLLALEMGYFEEPRATSLEAIAAELGISQPSAGGRLRRGMRRLLLSTIADDVDESSNGR